MPGIVGLITKKGRQWAEPQILRMVRSICHESFYETGTWADETAGVYVGWSLRKGSFSSGMPLRNESGDICLIFSGEEFPDPGTAQQLRRRGHAFESAKAGYLVHACEEDPGFIAKLNGRFQGIIIDQQRGAATLFNDRYGMHRVYYHEASEAFYFAAEAKAILEVRPELRSIDSRGFGEFVRCGCVLENRTLFKEIQVLPPASAWAFSHGSLERKNSYFKPAEWETQERLDEETYYQELRKVFAGNLERYFAGEERVGMSLTGGLDSRMILAWHKAAPNELPCYTFGGTYRDCQDVVISRAVARVYQQPYKVIPLGEEFLGQFANYAERAVFLTDGCVGVNRGADLYLNELAREIAPVRMTGNYGSEVLRWAPAFKPKQPDLDLFSTDVIPSMEAAGATYDRMLEGHPVSFAVFQQAPWHHYGLLALEQTQLTVRTPYLDNDLVRTVFRSPKPEIASGRPKNSDVCLRLISDGSTQLRAIRTDLGLNGGGFASKAMRKFQEFTFKAEYAYDSGMPQWMARVDHSLSALQFERLFLGRHKFSHFRVWYRDALAAYIREMLLDPRSLARPYLRRGRVEEIVNGHLKGNCNFTNQIHMLLTLELIHRLFLDS